jgi:ABC-type glycerol-3-phosphate transport system permease component
MSGRLTGVSAVDRAVAAMPRRALARRGGWSALVPPLVQHAGLLVVSLVFVFPFYWMVVSSLKPLADIFSTPIQFWPVHPILNNYLEVLGLIASPTMAGRTMSMPRAFLNSAIIGVAYTVAAVFLSSLSGFSFAKLRFRGSRVLFVIMLVTIMIPQSVGLIPSYLIMSYLGWIDTWWPLIVPGLASAFAVFWMRQYMSSVPDEMLEAAQIDGCGPFGLYRRIAVPVSTPGLAALAIFLFMGNWNAFLGPLIYLKSVSLYTIPIFLAILDTSVNGLPTPYHLVFAAAAISILPILAVFVGAQRYFIAGLTTGSVK